MALPTRARVRALLSPPPAPCVSVYLPTARAWPEKQQDAKRFRNLLDEAEASVRAKYDSPAARELVQKFRRFGDDPGTWQHPVAGVGALGGGDVFEVFHLTRPPKEMAVVADSFHLKPLLRHTQSADRFHVLGLTRTEAVLYEGDRYGVEPLSNGLPTFTEAVGEEIDRPGSQQSKITRGGRSPSTGHYSGYGGRKDEIDADNEKWFRAIADAVLERYSVPTGFPLVLMALPDNAAEFKAKAKNRQMLDEIIPHDPGSVTPDQVRDAAWKILEPRYTDRLAKISDDFRTARARNLATDVPEEAVRAALDGRLGVLLIDADKTVPGKIDHETRVTWLEGATTPGADDLLDDLAEQTLKIDGEVVVVPHDRMPTETGVAAIFRF